MSDHHEIFTQFFLDPEVIFSSYTMFINAPTKEFTFRHLVTFSISCSLIQNEVLLRLAIGLFVYGRNVYE